MTSNVSQSGPRIPRKSVGILQGRPVATHLAALWPQIEFLHTSMGDATRGGTKDVAHAVYYRWSHDGKWALVRHFRSPERAVALILDMVAAALRRKFDLSALEIIKIDLLTLPQTNLGGEIP